MESLCLNANSLSNEAFREMRNVQEMIETNRLFDPRANKKMPPGRKLAFNKTFISHAAVLWHDDYVRMLNPLPYFT